MRNRPAADAPSHKRPRALREGDTVALLALSSPARDPEEVAAARAVLEGFGWNVRLGSTLRLNRDYLAGAAAQRAADLARAVADPKVRALFFLRGGYGSAQLLGLADFRAIARRRLLVAGFSDLTTILNALDAAGLATLHVPTLASHFLAKAPTEAERTHFAQLVSDRTGGGWSLQERTGGFHVEVLGRGTARGALLGGNLEVFHCLAGTDHLPDPTGRILFLEDVNEAPYAIDRSLTHLRAIGYLDALAGIAFGQFTACESKGRYRWSALEAAREATRGLRMPILWGLPAGHGYPSFALPFGVPCVLDCRRGDLVFEEGFVA